MRNSLKTAPVVTSLMLAAIVSSGAAELQVAASDECHKRCQSIENQCRMASKDLDSSKCTAKFLACIQSCRAR